MTPRRSFPATTRGGIRYDIVPGEGVPVVLLHAGVADRRMWDCLRLPAGVSVIYVDLRGFGESVTDARDWTHADDVLEVLDELGIAEADVVAA